METRELHPVFAAEVTGVDAAVDPSPGTVEFIERAMAEYAVVVLPGQGHVTDERHAEFSRFFGPRETPAGVASGHRTKKYRLGRYMFDASNLDVDGSLLPADHPRRSMRAGDALWHTDSSFNPMPTKWSMLRAVAVPPRAADRIRDPAEIRLHAPLEGRRHCHLGQSRGAAPRRKIRGHSPPPPRHAADYRRRIPTELGAARVTPVRPA